MPKAAPSARASGDTFTISIDGVEFTSLPLSEVFTPRWVRLNRRLEDLDAGYTMVEDAFEGVEGFLDAWDGLSFEVQAEEIAALQQSMRVGLGESSRSST